MREVDNKNMIIIIIINQDQGIIGIRIDPLIINRNQSLRLKESNFNSKITRHQKETEVQVLNGIPRD